MPDGLNGDFGRLAFWIPVHAGADIGEGQRFDLQRFGQLKGVEVTVFQEIGLALAAAVPDGAHGVDDVFGRQVPGRGIDGFARGAAALSFPDEEAFFQDRLAAPPVDGAIDAPAPEQGVIGGVDDGVDGEVGDVGAEEFNV